MVPTSSFLDGTSQHTLRTDGRYDPNAAMSKAPRASNACVHSFTLPSCVCVCVCVCVSVCVCLCVCMCVRERNLCGAPATQPSNHHKRTLPPETNPLSQLYSAAQLRSWARTALTQLRPCHA